MSVAAPIGLLGQAGKDYKELKNHKKINVKAWAKTTKPLYASFASKDVSFEKNELPNVSRTDIWGETGWRGERIATQLLLWSGKGASNVALHLSDLETADGQKISADNCTTGFLRYVMSDKFGADGCAPRVAKALDSMLVADVIDDKLATVNLKAQSVQPVWLTLNIPAEAASGKYKGFITVTANELEQPITMTVNVFVRDRQLPPPAERSFYLNLWHDPLAVARYHKLTPWSKAHFETMKPMVSMLKQCGQKSISINLSGSASDEADYGLLTYLRRVNSTWSIDFTKLDTWVEFMMSMGIDRELCAYLDGGAAQAISYFDQASNSVKVQTLNVDSREYSDYLSSTLTLLAGHLKAKGWLNKTSVCLKEVGKERLQKYIAAVLKADNTYKISYLGSYFPDVEKHVDHYSVSQSLPLAATQKESRKKAGLQLCFYAPCSDESPNTYVFSPSAEAAWIGWYAAANGYDGYMRQAYNSWGKQPLKDSRSALYAAGYQCLVYPEGRSSVRLERLVEGIQDFEKVKILQQQLDKTNDKVTLNKLQKVLQTFTLDKLKKQPTSTTVDNARALLNSL
jgi:hypothetical protein